MHRFNSLVEVSVDYGALEEQLDEINEKLAALETSKGVDEDRVRDIISEEGVDEDRVGDIFREMAHDEGEDLIQRVVENMDFVTADDVGQQIRDADYVDQSTLDNAIDELRGEMPDTDALVDRVIEALPDNEDVDTLKRDMADLARRLDVYANKADSVRTFEDRIERLEEKLVGGQGVLMVGEATLSEVLERQANRIMALEDRIDIMAERLGDNNVMNGVTLLDLLRRAYQIIVGGRA